MERLLHINLSLLILRQHSLLESIRLLEIRRWCTSSTSTVIDDDGFAARYAFDELCNFGVVDG